MEENLLTIPNKAGELVLKQGGVVTRPLLSTDKFARFCRYRSLSVNRKRLLRLERLKLFAPIFRLQMPDEDTQRLSLPLSKDDEWFNRGWAWDTSSMEFDYVIPDATNRDCEAYYSVFQIDHLNLVLSQMTHSLQLDGFLDRTDGKPVDSASHFESWIGLGQQQVEALNAHRYRPAVALLCQFISDRYYPQTRTDQRTIKVPLKPRFCFDQWTETYLPNWDWNSFVRKWDVEEVARVFDLTPKKLEHAYNGLAISQSSCDPLERWYQLVQFISITERDRLKGDALRAETIRSGAFMLRLLYKDLYKKELPHPNEITSQIITHLPELEVRNDKRLYLEFVVNRFNLNPRPKLSLIVEGPSEESAIRLIFEQYFGADPGTRGIEIVALGSVDNATGGKQDKFRAILRLIDYQHHHQTLAFLILDNENYASKLKQHARKAKSIHHQKRLITRPEYIKVWVRSFELDNFSATEIASAFDQLCGDRVHFTSGEVAACKHKDNPGAALVNLYKFKTRYGLEKLKLAKILVERMLAPTTRRRVENRPIIKVLERVAALAGRNPFPTSQKTWETNQTSKHLAKKRR